MAIKEELAAKLAGQMAEVFSKGIYGDDGPDLDCDIDQIEDVAVLAARAAFDAVIAQALELQNQRLPDRLPCPKCQTDSSVQFETRTIQGRMGPAEIREPVCHCPVCDRDFFPSAGNLAAG
jgi:hypothetical protein